MIAIAQFVHQDGTVERHEVGTSTTWFDLDPDEGPVDPVKYAGASTPGRIFIRRRRIHPHNFHGPFQSCVEPVTIMERPFVIETYYKELVRP